MPRKFPWLTLFILLFSTSSICLLFIPYPETKQLDPGYPFIGQHLSQNSYTYDRVEFPWRSFNQKIYLNISVFYGTISLQVVDRFELTSFLRGEPYDPYWEIENITLFETTIQITPPFQGDGFILFKVEEVVGDEEDLLLYSKITVYYLRYASNYGFFFLGLAVILISYYGYIKYKMKSKY